METNDNSGWLALYLPANMGDIGGITFHRFHAKMKLDNKRNRIDTRRFLDTTPAGSPQWGHVPYTSEILIAH